MSRHTYKLLTVVLLGAVLGVTWQAWWGVPAAYAEPFNIPQGTDTAIADIVTKIVLALNLLTWVLFTLLNYILDPVFMFDLDTNTGEDTALMDMLNTIWQLSRDLVNVFFAVALIGAAIYTIITANKEFLNEHAQKFVLAVVLVNFSWFLPRIAIDASNVLAATIYNIPSLLQNEPQACTYWSSFNKGPQFCQQMAPKKYLCACTVVVDAQFLLEEEEANNLSSPANGYNCILGNLMCYKEELLSANPNIAGHSAILNGLVINHARLAELAQVPAPAAGNSINQLLMFIVQEVLILIIHIALFFPLLAMTAAFLIRIPVLWITIAFMPFYFLTFVGGVDKIDSEGTLKKILDTFLKMAFLPAIVAVPLAIGFIMINAGANITLGQLDNIPIRLFDGISNFGQLLWLVLCLGVIWVGVFKALSQGGEVVSGITEKIRDTGKSVGNIAAKAPLSMAPIPMLGGMTPLAFMKSFSPRAIEGAMNTKEGLKGYLDAFKKGNPTEAADRQGAAKKIKADVNLRERIEKQIDVVAKNPKDSEGLVRALKDAGFNQVNADNFAEKLKALNEDFRKENDNRGFDPLENNPAVKAAIDKIAKEQAEKAAKPK